jgi:hypothetical protein
VLHSKLHSGLNEAKKAPANLSKAAVMKKKKNKFYYIQVWVFQAAARGIFNLA